MRQKFADIFCAVFRHSHLVTNCFNYKNCARCGQQLGDTLAGTGLLPTGKGGFFQIDQICTCADCRKAFDSLNWIDKFMCPKAKWPTEEFIRNTKKERARAMASLRG
jgi:hypothetical protein